MPTKKKSFTYPYPRPSVTVDLIAFAFRQNELQVLMVRRKSPPFQGMLAFPGGFLEMDEAPATAGDTRDEGRNRLEVERGRSLRWLFMET